MTKIDPRNIRDLAESAARREAKQTMPIWLCSRFDCNRMTNWYVSDVPGDGGKDWGYSLDYNRAKQLPDYWKRRFLRDMRRVNATANAIEIRRSESC